MIPDYVLSSEAVPSEIYGAKAKVTSPTVDFEDGGIALNDPSEGLLYQEWAGRIVCNEIVLNSPTVADTVIYSGAEISEMSFTFDQNMRPAAAFVDQGTMALLWYDTSLASEVVTYISGSSPRIVLDDKRAYFLADSDIILFYLKGNQLLMRLQRDRFLNVYTLTSVPDYSRLVTAGMGTHYRMQITNRVTVYGSQYK